ncbi:hypothetical protein R1sor_004580 [Riccia sorocarpa]|uniref:Reverse transcriptase domain-containing protein n=1 Tax=Riccia sorocarpa TaxID=122646 RepID=A0ABD3HKL6_9MARC
MGRIRHAFRKQKQELNKEIPDIKLLQEDLTRMRRIVQDRDSEENRNAFEAALNLLRKREQLDAHMFRVRCRIRWIRDGEAPTRFFFARYKAKMAQERINALQLESELITMDEERIFEEVRRTFTQLYQEEPEADNVEQLRQDLLSLTDKRLTTSQNRSLRTRPTEEFIKEVVFSLPSDKAPGIDGVTFEVLVECWSFLQADCYEMVAWFWDKRGLKGQDKKGVIRLIPKEGDRLLLKDWRPITLLTTTYKVIAKILALRLKSMLPDIIDVQQTGFVAGRSIVDNVLSLRLAQEWAATSVQDVLFIKLDFQKAYDRVSHKYLWATMAALGAGFSRKNLAEISIWKIPRKISIEARKRRKILKMTYGYGTKHTNTCNRCWRTVGQYWRTLATAGKPLATAGEPLPLLE